MNIYLQKRKGKKGKTSLYLTYVNGKQKRRYEFLKLYLYEPPKDHEQRRSNKNVMKLANTILAQKIVDLQYSQHGLIGPIKGKIGLLQFFKSALEKKNDSLGNIGNWKSTLKHLKNYLNGEDIQLDKVDEIFLRGFQDYLLTQKIGRGKRLLARNSALSYYTKLAVLLAEAWKGRYIKENPAKRLKSIKPSETHRAYLTVEELKRLMQTPCEKEELKTAFLFSCFTGLRFSDVQRLEWQQFQFSEVSGWSLTFTQRKTNGAEVLPIAHEAMQLLRNFSAGEGKIFANLSYSSWNNLKLKQWMLKAGIVKPITFHSSRHSFATFSLSMDTDIYTVSKLLGHKHIRTTQIYTKIIDQKKIEAVNKFSSFLN